ncbi:MAG: cytochrome o ubiquinol oxidase subunit I [Burkholderiales bacterium]|nr:cytochrome o ubiquinol oxidase subunit I [Burkholderiales bacterium]
MNDFLGRLTWDAIPIHEPPAVIAGAMMIGGFVFLVALVTYFKKWGYLWKEWFTSVDHKRIGLMYIIIAIVMLLRGFADAALMRTQQAISVGSDYGFLPPDHYNQIFTAHGVIMIFFVAMPLVVGLMNLVVPLQIGARDVAFPYLNSLSFWLFMVGMVLMMLSLVVGSFATTGWINYAPLSEKVYSPGVGVDYYIWALQISGIGTTISGINFFVTIIKMRCPGMTLMKMPVFTWTALCSNILIIISFPMMTAALALLTLDRYLGFHFFTDTAGGNPMLYVNLIWAWGHPEVYILVLPAFGVFSEVTSTFSRKPLFGYATMVYATVSITVLSFIVWLHHFFTMGAGANVNAFFGIMTTIIAIPTGVKIFNWLFTMFRGRIWFAAPMYFTVGFIITFSIGGMTGVLLAVPGADFVLHNSLFVIAHFHNVIIGGVVFACMAGLSFWCPKALGFKMNEGLGKASFWFWLVGFYVAFMPLYVLGFMGATRRISHYDFSTGWHPLFVVAFIGMLLIAIGIGCQVLQILVSVIKAKQNQDYTGDPWDGRTLEWATSSPPPFYNFARIPTVTTLEPHWDAKHNATPIFDESKPYEDIHMPRNTGVGAIIGLFAFTLSFGLIWYIWWLVAASGLAIFACVVARSLDHDIDYYVPAEEVERIENELMLRRNKA